MKKKSILFLSLSAGLFALYIIFTLSVKFIDVSAIGPEGSKVGFSTINGFFKSLFGANLVLYKINDLVSLITILPGAFFATLGITMWVKRKDLKKVDKNILALGITYILTFAVYAIFQFVVINRRPVLIDGLLEASYPSSTTILSAVVLITAVHGLGFYVKNNKLRVTLDITSVVLCILLIVTRLISGVHWFTDICGGLIVSSALILLYFGLYFLLRLLEERRISEEKIEEKSLENLEETIEINE